MNQEPTLETTNLKDTELLIREIELVLCRINLLRIEIALYLLSAEVSPLWGETSDN